MISIIKIKRPRDCVIFVKKSLYWLDNIFIETVSRPLRKTEIRSCAIYDTNASRMPDIKCNPDDQFCSYISTEENIYGIGCTSDTKICFIIPFDGNVRDSTGFVQLNCKYKTGHQNYIYLIHVMTNCSRDTYVSICNIWTSPQKSGKISKTKYLPKDMHNILMCRKYTENAWSSFIRFFYGNLSMRYFLDLYFTLSNKTAFQAHHL